MSKQKNRLVLSLFSLLTVASTYVQAKGVPFTVVPMETGPYIVDGGNTVSIPFLVTNTSGRDMPHMMYTADRNGHFAADIDAAKTFCPTDILNQGDACKLVVDFNAQTNQHGQVTLIPKVCGFN